ncbi:MAG: GntR family transcriptional regulator [Chloroflexota bacterium]
MNIDIHFQTHVPIYIQVMDQIRHKVVAEELKPGDQLPTVRQLAADLRVNFNTIARSYRLLDDAGIISTQHGRGTFILEQLNPESTEKLRQQTLVSLADHFLTEAHRLGHSPKEVKSLLNQKVKLWEQEGSPASPEASNIN